MEGNTNQKQQAIMETRKVGSEFFEWYFTERLLLTCFMAISHLYTSWKRQKTSGFLTFSGGVEMEYCLVIGYEPVLVSIGL